MPKVSVILTSFNHEKYLQEAIESALNQTFTDFELIIWDDASSDNSWYLITQYSDQRIKAFRNEEQKRGIWGINKAISEVVTGEYIAIHHSDDVWELDKLEKQVAFMDANPEIGAVFTNALAIGEDSSPLSDEKHYYSNIFDQPNRTRYEWLRFFFSIGNALCHPSVLIRKSCYEDCGLYRYGMAQVPDFDMWIRLCLRYEIHVMSENLVRFRVRENEANASGNRPETRIRTLYEFYKALSNYRKIEKFDDLVKVFPSAAKFYRNEEMDTEFILAMIALEEKPFTFTQLFGLDLLFEAISDPKRSANIKRLYDFDYKSFISLTAQHDVFSREDVTTLREDVTTLWSLLSERDGQIASLNRQLAELYSSTSWRVTEPLRLIKRALPGFPWVGRKNSMVDQGGTDHARHRALSVPAGPAVAVDGEPREPGIKSSINAVKGNYDSSSPKLIWDDDLHLKFNDVSFYLSIDTKELQAGKSTNDIFLLGKPRHMVEKSVAIRQQQKIGKIFEMGILQGGSVVLYDQIFQPEKIVAIELKRKPVDVLASYIEKRRKSDVVKPYYGINQADRSSMEKILSAEFPDKDVDLIIDDASHLYDETREAFNISFPYLGNDGLYIIEDWAWAHWSGDYWQNDNAYFNGRKALSNLLIELFMLAASRPDFIKDIIIEPSVITVKRGDGALPAGEFNIADHYLLRGKQFGAWL